MPELTIILEDIRSAHNVGSILRSADGLGLREVIFCGITPYPRRDSNYPRLPHIIAKTARQIHKTALGAEESLNLKYYQNISQAIEDLRQEGWQILALEQSPNSISLADYIPPKNSKIALIVGNEVNGVDSETLQITDQILEIPMLGKKESFNVAVSAAIGLYELRKKMLE